jgi:hypothetical protein
MKTFLFPAAFVIAALVSGCTAADQSSDTDSSTDDLTAQSILVGTYTITGATDTTMFNSLTLKSNHTFTGQGGCRQDTSGPHCFAITAPHGTWKTAKSGPQLGAPGGAAELVFTDSFGQKTTYFYSLTSDQLALSTTYRGDESLFDKDISGLKKLKSGAICADKYDNSLGICPEDLPCEYDGPSGETQRCLPPI